MGLWQLSRAAWRDTFEAMRRNASLFTLVLIGLLIVTVVFNRFVAAPQAQLLKSGDLAGATLNYLPAEVLVTLLKVCLLAPCAVTVHRSILLGEPAAETSVPDIRRWGLFAAWLAFFQLATLVVSALADRIAFVSHSGGVPVAVIYAVAIIVLMVAIAIVTVRMTLLFPALATDIPAPYQRSWELTHGHWWSICGTMAFNGLGVGLIAIIPLGLATLIARSPIGVLPSAVSAGLEVLSAAVFAAVASWLYRRYTGFDAVPASPWELESV